MEICKDCGHKGVIGKDEDTLYVVTCLGCNKESSGDLIVSDAIKSWDEENN